jgi:hypothetical protein
MTVCYSSTVTGLYHFWSQGLYGGWKTACEGVLLCPHHGWRYGLFLQQKMGKHYIAGIGLMTVDFCVYGLGTIFGNRWMDVDG